MHIYKVQVGSANYRQDVVGQVPKRDQKRIGMMRFHAVPFEGIRGEVREVEGDDRAWAGAHGKGDLIEVIFRGTEKDIPDGRIDQHQLLGGPRQVIERRTTNGVAPLTLGTDIIVRRRNKAGVCEREPGSRS